MVEIFGDEYKPIVETAMTRWMNIKLNITQSKNTEPYLQNTQKSDRNLIKFLVSQHSS